MDPEERDLVRAARNGDEEAFGRLVERTQSRLARLLRGMVRDDDEAMDLVQETYIKAHRSLDTFREGSAFGTWLHRIGVNTAIDQLRKRAAFAASSIEGPASAEGDTPDPAGASERPTPDRVLEGEEAGKALRRALNSMPPEHKATILLRDRRPVVRRDRGDHRHSRGNRDVQALLRPPETPRSPEGAPMTPVHGSAGIDEKWAMDLMAYRDGELDSSRRNEIGRHILECGQCQSILRDFGKVGNLVREMADEDASRLAETPVWPRVRRALAPPRRGAQGRAAFLVDAIPGVPVGVRSARDPSCLPGRDSL